MCLSLLYFFKLIIYWNIHWQWGNFGQKMGVIYKRKLGQQYKNYEESNLIKAVEAVKQKKKI